MFTAESETETKIELLFLSLPVKLQQHGELAKLTNPG